MQVTIGDGKKIKLTQDITTMTPDGIMTFRKCLFDFLIIWISNPAKDCECLFSGSSGKNVLVCFEIGKGRTSIL